MAKKNRYIDTKNVTTVTRNKVNNTTTYTSQSKQKKSINYSRVTIDSTILLIILIIVSTVISVIVPTKINQYDINFNTIDIVEEKTNQYDHAYDLWIRSIFFLNNTSNNVFITDTSINTGYVPMVNLIDVYNLKSLIPNYNDFWFKISNFIGNTSSNNYFIGNSNVSPSLKLFYFSSIDGDFYFDIPWDYFTSSSGLRYLGVGGFFNTYLDFSFQLELLPKVESNLGTQYLKYDRNILSVNDYNELDNVVLANDFKLYKSEEYLLDISYFSGNFSGSFTASIIDTNNVVLYSVTIDSTKYYDTTYIQGLRSDLNDLRLVVNAPIINTNDTMLYINLLRTSLNEELSIGNIVVSNYTGLITKIVNYGKGIPTLFESFRNMFTDFLSNIWNSIVYFFTLKWLPF